MRRPRWANEVGRVTLQPLERLRRELLRCPFHDFLGLEAVDVELATSSVIVRLPYRQEFRHSRDHDFFHGGLVAALADITGHAAVAVALGRATPTIDLRVDYLRPARGAALLATGHVRRAGRSIATADVEVRDPGGVTVACGRGTFSTLV
jgi:uncharacterized protein (TIGR00369 family)